MEVIAVSAGFAVFGIGLIWAVIVGQKNGKLEQKLKATEDALYVERKAKEFMVTARDRALSNLETFKELARTTDSSNLNSLFSDAPTPPTHTDSTRMEEPTTNENDDGILRVREEDQGKEDS